MIIATTRKLPKTISRAVWWQRRIDSQHTFSSGSVAGQCRHQTFGFACLASSLDSMSSTPCRGPMLRTLTCTATHTAGRSSSSRFWLHLSVPSSRVRRKSHLCIHLGMALPGQQARSGSSRGRFFISPRGYSHVKDTD